MCQWRNSPTGCLAATVVVRKSTSNYASSYLTAFIASLKFKRILLRTDTARSLLSLIKRVSNNLLGVDLVLLTSPESDHAADCLAKVSGREIRAHTRILRSQVEQRLSNRISKTDPLTSGYPRHAANCVSRFRLMDDGRAPAQRRCSKTWKRPVVYFGSQWI